MSSHRPELRLDWCSHEAARYACTRWHYSKRMPKSKLAKLGVWEDGRYVGAVIFGVGATADLVKSYGLTQTEGCELVRVALRNHVKSVSRVISIALRILKIEFPRLRLIVSFADPEAGHHGGIYQAGGWVYTGRSSSSDEYIIGGRRYQGRSFRNKFKGMEHHPAVRVVSGSSKHRYLRPLDDEMRARIAPLAQPYPKRVKQATDGRHPDSGGAAPTHTLQTATQQVAA